MCQLMVMVSIDGALQDVLQRVTSGDEVSRQRLDWAVEFLYRQDPQFAAAVNRLVPEAADRAAGDVHPALADHLQQLVGNPNPNP